jgi:predicted LPLAT superfamily acyltransferase
MTPSAQAAWTQREERGSRAALTLMRWLSLGLGRRLSRLLLPFIALYFLLAAPAARRASHAYLTRALGRPPTWLDIARHFHAFASTVHDRAFLLNDRFDQFDIELESAGEVERALETGGVFVVGAHFGSFEVVRAASRSAAAQGRRCDVTMVMYEDNARRISAALAALSPHGAPRIIGLGRPDAMLQVRQALDAGGLVGFLADRTLGDQPTISVPFLGTEAPFPTGAFRLAALLRRQVLLMQGIYLGGRRYRVRFAPLADFSDLASEREALIRQAVTRYAAELEQACRAHPYNWFNFYDFWSSDATGAAR